MNKRIKTWSTPVCGSLTEKVPCALCGGSVFVSALECEGYGFVRCRKCGLVQMNPQPTKEEISARYGSAYGNDYLQYELKNEDNFLKLQQLALRGQTPTPTHTICSVPLKKSTPDMAVAGLGSVPTFLDIGCATGALLAFMRDKGWQVTGVEISPSADYAIKTRGLDVKKVPLEDCKFADSCFDVVHASHLIEHLKDPRSFLNEVYRILKPGGSLYISTPNIDGFQAKLFGNKWRSAIFDHLYLFSRRTLKKLLQDTGFKIKRIRTWGGLAVGSAPSWLKKIVDRLAKIFGFGDVMIIFAKK